MLQLVSHTSTSIFSEPTIAGIQPFAELSRGQTTAVYKAYREATSEVVLLKVLAGEAAGDPALVDWFEHEASAVAEIDHPNVVALLDAGRDENGRPYLITEYVEGASLEQLLADNGSFPPELAAYVGAEIAKALAAAHEAGILHRDVKPANILIGGDGTVKLTDFGLASQLKTGSDGLTRTVRGTPGYLAPEAVRGEETGRTADLFALGATLVELLTGNAAYPASDVREALDSALHHDPIPALASDPRIPFGLTTAIGMLLDSDPGKRASAEESAEMLKESAVYSGPSPGAVNADELAQFLTNPVSYRAAHPVVFHQTPSREAASSSGAVVATPVESTTRWLRFAPVVLLGVLLAAVALLALQRDEVPADSVVAQTDRADSFAVDLQDPVESNEADLPQFVVPEQDNSLPPTIVNPQQQETAQAALDEPRQNEEPRSNPQPPREQESAPTAQPGRMTVVVQPWAEVYVDGRKVGEGSQVRVDQLAAGTHQIVLRNPEFPTISRSAEVRPGGDERLAISLWDQVARITFQVHPWATLSVDGRVLGDVPPERTAILQPGTHAITLTHPQLGTWTGSLSVSAGDRRTVPFNMNRLLGDTID